jgi:hypothetical protein
MSLDVRIEVKNIVLVRPRSILGILEVALQILIGTVMQKMTIIFLTTANSLLAHLKNAGIRESVVGGKKNRIPVVNPRLQWVVRVHTADRVGMHRVHLFLILHHGRTRRIRRRSVIIRIALSPKTQKVPSGIQKWELMGKITLSRRRYF